MTVGGISLRDLHHVWADLWPLLEPAVKRSPDFSTGDRAEPDVLARLIARDAQLWAIYEGCKPIAAIVTTIQISAFTGAGEEKRCLLWLIGGSRVKEWAADFLAACEAWARDTMGCVAMWGAGRAGWVRMVKKFGGKSIGIVDGQPAWERRIA
jgi:hypothetical protein